ncbi:MAG: AI-2E family transporter [Bdellovibrionales bacterium]|nr:AI-2E family transporter [Oligoflexia bacterium]
MNTDNRLFYTLLPIALVAIGYLLEVGSPIFLWIICAFFLFAIIDPWMNGLTKRGVTPIISALLLVIVTSTLLFGLGFLFYRSSATLINQLGDYRSAISQFYQKMTLGMHQWVHSFSSAPPGANPHAGAAAANAVQAATNVSDPAASIPNKLGEGVVSGIGSVLNVLTFITLTPLLTFFMIAEKEQFGMMFAQILKNEEKAKKMRQSIGGVINAYFLGNLALIFVSLPVFVLVFWLVGVKAYVSLGLISAICNLVPFLGFILAALLPALDLIMNGGHLGGVLILLGACFFTHFAVANVLTPKLLGSKVDLNATASTIALIAWGHLWGPFGLLLAIPVTAILKIFCQNSDLPVFQHCAALMSENPKSLHLRSLKFISHRIQKKA